MKTNVSEYDFINGFSIRPDSFSRAGLQAIYDYLLDYEDSCDTEIEYDPIAICGEFTEYADLAEFHDNYDKSDYPDFDTIEDYACLIPVAGANGFIIQDF